MNYLAHLYFAEPTPESVLGNLAADHFKGLITGESPFEQALRRHRAIDAFTDAHPAVAVSRKRLEAGFRHYSRVIVDVLYDHLLATGWERYSDEPFERFCSRMNRIVGTHAGILPQPIRGRFQRMAAQNWLASYREIDGIRTALHFMSRRLRHPVELERSVDVLVQRFEDFSGDFDAFFPELVRFLGEVDGVD